MGLPLPLSGATWELDHAPADIPVTARLTRDGPAFIVELAIDEGGRIADHYQVAPDGTLTMTRTIARSGAVADRHARFLYWRLGAPST